MYTLNNKLHQEIIKTKLSMYLPESTFWNILETSD